MKKILILVLLLSTLNYGTSFATQISVGDTASYVGTQIEYGSDQLNLTWTVESLNEHQMEVGVKLIRIKDGVVLGEQKVNVTSSDQWEKLCEEYKFVDKCEGSNTVIVPAGLFQNSCRAEYKNVKVPLAPLPSTRSVIANGNGDMSPSVPFCFLTNSYDGKAATSYKLESYKFVNPVGVLK